jgi:SM-20-related protein
VIFPPRVSGIFLPAGAAICYAMIMLLRLNPSLDAEVHARAYAETKCVQINGLFEPAIADVLEQTLLSLPWRLVTQDERQHNILLTRDLLAAMSPAEKQKLEEGVRARAAQNFGYCYFCYPMIDARLGGWDEGHPIHALTDFLNSPDFLAFARTIIGNPAVTKIDAQASNYRCGHFLTRHKDDGAKQERRAAYTIGFSRNWQTDWGGLLMFIDDKLDVTRAFLPRFNVLTVFDGMMLHAVSPVSAFAPAPRLSIAGWFRDDPPAGRQR